MNIEQKLGERIRRYRVSRGLTQDHLAKMIGISFQQVQKYEKGINRVTTSCLLTICARLGVPVTDMLDGLVNCEKFDPMPNRIFRVADDFNRIRDKKLQDVIHQLIRLFSNR